MMNDPRSRRKIPSSVRGNVLAAVVLCFAILLYFQQNTLLRLYNVQFLFDEKSIVENFRSMTDLGFPYVNISRGEGPIALLDEKDSVDLSLPKTFEWNHTTHDLETWLSDHWTTGMIVLKRNAVTSADIYFESYYLGNTETSRCVSWSMCKSVVSTAIGIAVDQGLLNIEKTVTDYVPSLMGTGYEGVRVKDVLQMSSGVGFDEDYFNPLSDINVMGYTLALGFSMDSFVKTLKNERVPGTFNHYVSIDTQVLSMVLAAATGSTLASFLETNLWKKIGCESDATILLDNEDDRRELAFGIFSATVRDYARFGWLWLNKGLSPVSGERILSKEWVHDATTVDAPHLMPGSQNVNSDYPSFGYGYQWWVLPDEKDASAPGTDFMAIGVYNQFIFVSPQHDIVIAKTSAFPFYESEQSETSHENNGELQAAAAFRAIAAHFASPSA